MPSYEDSYILAHDLAGLAMDLGDDYESASYEESEAELMKRIGGIKNLPSYIATIRIGKEVI